VLGRVLSGRVGWFTGRRVLAISAAIAASAAAAAIAPSPAAASGVTCSGAICADVDFVGGTVSDVGISAWAPTTTFNGHYQLLAQNRSVMNSGPNKSWPSDRVWSVRLAGSGLVTYCVIAWKYNGGSNYRNIGEVCQRP